MKKKRLEAKKGKRRDGRLWNNNNKKIEEFFQLRLN